MEIKVGSQQFKMESFNALLLLCVVLLTLVPTTMTDDFNYSPNGYRPNMELKDCRGVETLELCSREKEKIGRRLLEPCRSDLYYYATFCRCPEKPYCVQIVENSYLDGYQINIYWLTKPNTACTYFNETIGTGGPFCDPQRSLTCYMVYLRFLGMYDYTYCFCADGLEFSEEADECIPLRTGVRGINSPCITSSDCLETAGLECLDNKCKCRHNYAWQDEKCQSTKLCTTAEECGAGEEEECVNGTCTCSTDREYSDMAQACKLKAGEQCFDGSNMNNKFLHSVCLSQNCLPTKVCDCPKTVRGQNMVFSSSRKNCDLNHHSQFCGDDTDCRGLNEKADATSLFCNTMSKKCECNSGRSYSGSYCREVNRAHGEVCDRSGRGATCKVGLALGCAEAVLTRDYRCRCIPREDSKQSKPNSNKVFIPQIWKNGTCAPAQRKGENCTNTDDCMYEFECVNLTCAGKKFKRNDGKNRVDYLNKFLIVNLFSIILLNEFSTIN